MRCGGAAKCALTSSSAVELHLVRPLHSHRRLQIMVVMKLWHLGLGPLRLVACEPVHALRTRTRNTFQKCLTTSDLQRKRPHCRLKRRGAWARAREALAFLSSSRAWVSSRALRSFSTAESGWLKAVGPSSGGASAAGASSEARRHRNGDMPRVGLVRAGDALRTDDDCLDGDALAAAGTGVPDALEAFAWIFASAR